MDQVIRIGMDTSKHIFQLHGVNAAEAPVLRKKLRRKEMVAFFAKLEPTEIAIEACGASHHWARLLQSLEHRVKLIPPQLVKPYVKRGKNDAADAEALCEAMSRPTMRFVPVKTAEHQAALMLVGVRDRLIRTRTQLVNAWRWIMRRVADAEIGFAGVLELSIGMLVFDHELSHRKGGRGGDCRGNGPRSIMGPPQPGQMSRSCPVSRRWRSR